MACGWGKRTSDFFFRTNCCRRCFRLRCCSCRRRRRRRQVYDDFALKSHCQCEYKMGAHNLWWLHANVTQASGRERKRRKRNVYVPSIWALVGMFMSLFFLYFFVCVLTWIGWPLNIFCWWNAVECAWARVAFTATLPPKLCVCLGCSID